LVALVVSGSDLPRRGITCPLGPRLARCRPNEQMDCAQGICPRGKSLFLTRWRCSVGAPRSCTAPSLHHGIALHGHPLLTPLLRVVCSQAQRALSTHGIALHGPSLLTPLLRLCSQAQRADGPPSLYPCHRAARPLPPHFSLACPLFAGPTSRWTGFSQPMSWRCTAAGGLTAQERRGWGGRVNPREARVGRLTPNPARRLFPGPTSRWTGFSRPTSWRCTAAARRPRGCSVARRRRAGAPRRLASTLSLYKILFRFKALLWEPIILVLPPPTCKAYPIAILLNGHCAICDLPPTPLVYAIHHTYYGYGNIM